MRSATGKAKAPVIRATEAFNNESISQQNGFGMKVITKPQAPATFSSGDALERLKMVDLTRLQKSIDQMNLLSQDGFGQISAIAELAVAALESSPDVLNAELLAHAFRSILQKANLCADLVGGEAAYC